MGDDVARSTAANPAHDVELRGVTKRYESVVAVDRVDLAVARGEFVAILGPSGCGKTTTLRMIAGFLPPDDGTVAIRGAIVNGIPPHRRDFGMVFQNYALFPHLTVFDNVAFGLKIARIGRSEIQERVMRALATVNLVGTERRPPRQLSGGQQQRVALARAIVMNPVVLLLDEPLSNLDLKMRQSMRLEIKQIQRELGVTTVFVTHDQEEALTMSDRIVVMNQGRVEQVGTPQAIYEQPQTTFVADFIGVSNLIPGAAQRAGTNGLVDFVATGDVRIRTVARADVPLAEATTLLVRPEKIRVGAVPPETANVLKGSVRNLLYLGSTIRYYVAVGGHELIADSANVGGGGIGVGCDAYVGWAWEDALLLRSS